jgi:diguanylate cyclase (GGDEF)-like protein
MAGGALLLHGYGAYMLTRLEEFKGSLALRWLAAALAASAAVHMWRCAEAAFGLTFGPVSGVAPFGPLSLLASIVTLLAPAWLMPIVALLLIGDRNVDKLRAANRKLRFLADIDMLTRVSNRRHFQRLASRVLQAAPDGTAALMMFDIDHFKRINDLLGHASGDEALRQVARCMRDTLRGHDVAGRLGGDEFAVVLPQTSVDAAMSVAARIVAQLDDRQVAPRLAPVSLSFGVVQVRRGETLAEALRRADQALYEAKRQGRSRAVVATGREERPVFGESRPLGLIAR